jgi:Outer membrane protein beta-barrel domain
MPENEFEKKVSSEMQELKFKPSEKVWLQVEERIRKKKKRRVFVIIFLLAGLALLGYWQRDNLFGGKKNEIAKTGNEQQKENNPKVSEHTNTPSTIKQNTETPKQEDHRNPADRTKTEKPAVDQPVIDKKDILVSKKENNKLGKKVNDENKVKTPLKKVKAQDETKVLIDVASADPEKNKIIADNPKETVVDKTRTEPITKQEDVKQPEVKPLENKIDSVKSKIIDKEKIVPEKRDTILKADPAKEPAVPLAKKDSSQKKWKWGVHLTPGISTLNDNSISLGGMKSADATYYQNPSGGSGGVAPPTRQMPSDIKAGFAFQAGAFAQRQLSMRTSLSLGLQYGFYSQRLHIGNLRDSLIRNSQFSSVLDGNRDHIYNAGGDTVKYTNRYHFIELPLRFQWQLNKSKTNPFIWSTGFTLGQLIASNAIMYDTAFNGIYYENKKLLNKTQFSLSTGFSWTIANGKRAQWSIGPVVNIHLNRLINSPFENKRYLFFAGVRTGILFNQKK